MRKWVPLMAICLGTFMLLIDVTIVNVALPSIARDLHTQFSSLQWVVDAYALTLAALLLGVGTAADIVGHRLVYVVGLGLFAASSLVCGLAPNPGTLIAARAVQGVGGAAMLATTFALINASYRGRDRGTAYAFWGAVSGASAAVGPIIGGVLTQGLSWRWIFFVNVPVSVVAIAMSLLVLSGVRPVTNRRINAPGMLAFTAAATAFVVAAIQVTGDGWTSPTVLALFAAGLVALAVFVAIQARSAFPLLDLTLLRNRTFSGVLIAALLFNFAAFAYFTYTSIWLQTLLGLSPIDAGLVGLPLSVTAFVVPAVLGSRLSAPPPRTVITIGMLLIGIGALISALLIGDDSSWPALIPGFLVCGIGVGLAIPILSSTGVGAVPPEQAGMAGGAINTARQLGFALGIAVLGSIFTSRAAHALGTGQIADPHGLASRLAAGEARTIIASGSPTLATGAHTAFAAGLDAAFVAAGVAGLAGSVAAFVLIRAVKPHWETERTPVTTSPTSPPRPT